MDFLKDLWPSREPKAKPLTADVHQVSEENSNQMVAAREQQAAEW
jgi:hypothetical protein